MPIYDVEYTDKNGKRLSDTAEGENEGVVVEGLRKSGLYPLKINPSKSRQATLDIQTLAAERSTAEQRRDALDAKVQELRQRFEEGDDSVYEEMVAVARIVSEEPSYPQEMRDMWRRQLETLESAGSAEGLREGKGVPQARSKRILVAHGTMTEQSRTRAGTMVLVPNQGLAFGETDDFNDAEIFVKFREVEQIRKSGFFKKRMEIVSKGGQVFRFTVDRLRTPVPMQRLFTPQRLWLICQIEGGGFI